jgi:hypothetical protein
MAMSRKDYEKAAAILAEAKSFLPESAHGYLVLQFSAMFAADNPRFDRERFQSAAGGVK